MTGRVEFACESGPLTSYCPKCAFEFGGVSEVISRDLESSFLIPESIDGFLLAPLSPNESVAFQLALGDFLGAGWSSVRSYRSVRRSTTSRRCGRLRGRERVSGYAVPPDVVWDAFVV